MLNKLAQAVIEGEAEAAVTLAKKALELGMDPLKCITDGLTKGIQKVGTLFSTGDYFLPELVIGAEAMKKALEVLEPELLSGQTREIVATVVIGTVEGDIHEIGKTLVGTMLTANGFKVFDIGVNQSAEDFIQSIRETKATIVGASALLTTTMQEQGKLVKAIDNAGLRDSLKVMIGGAPVTADFAQEIGADGYAEDAISSVALAMRFADAPE